MLVSLRAIGRSGKIINKADCYTSNILSQLRSFDDWTEEDLYACMGRPSKHQLRRLDGGPRGSSAPEYTVDPGDVIALESRLRTDRILLIDFGAAFYHDERPPVVYTPAPLTSPEIHFGGEITSAVDKWAFGCLLYELCADRTLIKLLFGWNNDAKKDQVAMLGKPPDALWQNWEEGGKHFHSDRTPKESQGRRLKVDTLSLEQRVRNLESPWANETTVLWSLRRCHRTSRTCMISLRASSSTTLEHGSHLRPFRPILSSKARRFLQLSCTPSLLWVAGPGIELGE